jgi:hypothetical protein
VIIKSLNLKSPDLTLFNVSVSDLGETVVVEVEIPETNPPTGVRSIQLNSIWSLRVDNDGNLYTVDTEKQTSPKYVGIWFESPDGTAFRLTTDDAGQILVVETPYVRQPGTPFYVIYCRFLSKVTDDLYLEWTLEDTFKNLESIFMDALPQFEWPKFPLYNYSTQAIGMVAPDGSVVSYGKFFIDLTIEEINIFADLMLVEWLNRQITTVNLTRMKYSSKDFQFTSQANHIQKLLAAKDNFFLQSKRLQRLYQRRTIGPDGRVTPNYGALANSAITERWRLATIGSGWLFGSPINGGAWWTEELSAVYGGYSTLDPYQKGQLTPEQELALGLGPLEGTGTLANPRGIDVDAID